ncbi:MAG: 2-hydroxyglutaryl-CoA dehydratase [Deltaproteobacteria bacterium]|nr:2-hydroxyglutaryl-CoA dehydratase [Deltaproteobacteria bacterium]
MRCFAGIDVGSLTADAVLIDEAFNVIGYAILPTGNDSQQAGTRAYQKALERAGVLETDVAGVVSTGYSRGRVEEAGASKTEISCHARGAFYYFPDVGTIIDIGGQDSKAIRVGPDGRVIDFAMNDKCAAGTGRFLEVMAGALNMPLEKMDSLALASTAEIVISSTCTVFAESEVVSLISQGRKPADIASAICRAIANRTSGLVTRVGLADSVVMTGGVAKNKAVAKMLSEKLGHFIKVPEEPQIIGALGAAIFARENGPGL